MLTCRREYSRAYYARTAARRRMLAEHRRACRLWCQWLLTELRTNWPPEPEPVYAADLRDSLMEYR